MESNQSTDKYGFKFDKTPNGITLTPKEHKFSLIWLHGLGDTCEGFLDTFYSAKPFLPNSNTKVILLQAPT